jgi:hypothetical protein
MKTHSRNRGIAPLILYHGATWRSVVSMTHRPLYTPIKEPRYQLNRLAVPHSRSGRFGEDKLFSCRESNPGLSSPQPICCTEYYIPAPLRIR